MEIAKSGIHTLRVHTEYVCSIMIFYMMNSVLNGPISVQEETSHVEVISQMVHSHI